MAWATKYRTGHLNKQTGEMWLADIQQDGFLGSVTDLNPGLDPIAITYRTNVNHPNWIRAASTCEIEFIDDGSGLLSDLFQAGSQDFRLLITRDSVQHWIGYIRPDSYRYQMGTAQTSKITAIDGLSSLSNITWESAPGTPYSGQASFINILASTLEPLNLPDVGLQTHCFWFSYLSTNPLAENVHDPLRYHTKNRLSYRTADGLSLSCLQVLDDVLTRFKLQIYQTDGYWFITQRRKEQNIAPDIFWTYRYDSLGAPETPYLNSPLAKFNIQTGVNHFRTQPAEAVPQINQSSILYQHGQLLDLFDNQDFEEEGVAPVPQWAIQTTGGTVMLSNDGYDGSARSVSISPAFTTAATLNTAPSRWIEQTSNVPIEGASGYKIRFRPHLKLPSRPLLRVDDEDRRINWFFELEIGGDYYNHAAGTWDASPVINVITLHDKILADNWYEFSAITPVLDSLSGNIRMRMYGVNEENDLVFGATQIDFLIDQIDFDILTPLGELLTMATVTSVVATGHNATVTLPTPTVLTGEGPLSTFQSAIFALDSTEAAAGIATDWSYGVEASENNKNIDVLHGEETVAQFFLPARTITATIIHASTTPETTPEVFQFASVERPNETNVFDDYTWFNSLVFRPSQPERIIDTSWAQLVTADPGTLVITTRAVNEVPGTGNAILSGSFGSISISTTTVSVTVDTIADLVDLPVGDMASTVFVRQYAAGGAATGGGIFVGDPTDTFTQEDGGTVFVSDDAKRWKRIFAEDDPWRTEWFGAKWDGSTNDSAAIQSTIDAAGDGATILLPCKSTVIATRILIDSKAIHLKGEAPAYFQESGQAGFPSSPSGTVILSGPLLPTSQFRIQDTITASGLFCPVTFENIHFIGNKDAYNQGTALDESAIEIFEVSKVRVINCVITNFTGGGVRTNDPDILLDNKVSDDLLFLGSTFAYNGETGLLIQANNSTVQNCQFVSNGAHGVSEGFSAFGGNTYLGCLSSNNVESGFLITGSLGNSRVVSCVASGNGAAGILVGTGISPVFNCTISSNLCTFNGLDSGNEANLRSGIVIVSGTQCAVFGNTLSDNDGYGIALVGVNKSRIQGNAGADNILGFTNLRAQKIDGPYNVLECGVLQRDNDASLIIQALIDSVDEGAQIHFPYGDYRINSTITINKSVHLIGVQSMNAGAGAFLNASATLNGPILNITAGGVVIDSLGFVGSAAAPSAAAAGIQVSSGSDSVIRNCSVSGFVGSGITAEAPAVGLQLSSCNISSNAQHGLFLKGVNTSVVNCRVNASGIAGIYSLSTIGLNLGGSFISGSGSVGLNLDGSLRSLISQNIFETSQQVGILVGSGGSNLISGNILNANGQDTGASNSRRAGIAIEAGNRNLVIGNHFADGQTTKTQLYAISTGDALGSADIYNNTDDGNLVTGFYLFDPTTVENVNLDLFAEATINFPSIPANGSSTTTATITGARAGDVVKLGKPTNWSLSLLTDGFVSSDDTVTLIVHNFSGASVDAPEGSWSIHLERRSGAGASVVEPPVEGEPIFRHVYTNPNLLQFG